MNQFTSEQSKKITIGLDERIKTLTEESKEVRFNSISVTAPGERNCTSVIINFLYIILGVSETFLCEKINYIVTRIAIFFN